LKKKEIKKKYVIIVSKVQLCTIGGIRENGNGGKRGSIVSKVCFKLKVEIMLLKNEIMIKMEKLVGERIRLNGLIAEELLNVDLLNYEEHEKKIEKYQERIHEIDNELEELKKVSEQVDRQ
jgi:hypothetical protein